MIEQIYTSPILRLALLLAIFVCVVLVSFFAIYVINRRAAVKKDLQAIQASGAPRAMLADSLKAQGVWQEGDPTPGVGTQTQ